jgi:hypothetical protein
VLADVDGRGAAIRRHDQRDRPLQLARTASGLAHRAKEPAGGIEHDDPLGGCVQHIQSSRDIRADDPAAQLVERLRAAVRSAKREQRVELPIERNVRSTIGDDLHAGGIHPGGERAAVSAAARRQDEGAQQRRCGLHVAPRATASSSNP